MQLCVDYCSLATMCIYTNKIPIWASFRGRNWFPAGLKRCRSGQKHAIMVIQSVLNSIFEALCNEM